MSSFAGWCVAIATRVGSAVVPPVGRYMLAVGVVMGVVVPPVRA